MPIKFAARSSSIFSKLASKLTNVDRKDKKMVKYLGQSEAINIDKELFEEYKFSVDQLMELAGQSCALAIAKCYPLRRDARAPVLVCCGPGNNGGDGLVCSRHLKLFGYEPEIYYPKRTKNQLYENLLHQCIRNNIPLVENIDTAFREATSRYVLIVDALFGFSFKPPVRSEFADVMDILKTTNVPICSIDIPSGWNVENGPSNDDFHPEMLVSLTAPKLCAEKFTGKYHFLGGRFVPKDLESRYDLNLPEYSGTNLIVDLKE